MSNSVGFEPLVGRLHERTLPACSGSTLRRHRGESKPACRTVLALGVLLLLSACAGQRPAPSDAAASGSIPALAWGQALETRRRAWLEGPGRAVAEANRVLYQEALARELAEVGSEVVLSGEDWLLVRLPGDQAFSVGSASLSDGARRVVAGWARVLESYELCLVEITGHTDATGSAKINQRLSADRAQAVVAQLESLGLSPGRVVAEGRADSLPIADNSTVDGRRANRRVDMLIVIPARGPGDGH